MKKVFKITSPYGKLSGVLDEEELLDDEELEWQVIENYCELHNLHVQNATRKEQGGKATWQVVVFDLDTSRVYELHVEFKNSS